MLPYLSQIQILSDNSKITVQNPCAKSRAVSTPLCNIETSCNDFLPKPEDVFRLCFENTNGFPTFNIGCHYDKVKRLKHTWSRLNADLISLV